MYGTNLISRTVGGQSAYYFYNGHGDVTMLQDANGTVLATYYYDAFGNPTEVWENVNNPYRYAGYQWDAETGLYYLNARMYDPITARFLQEDTYRGNPNDPLSLNLYTYCHNEPMMYTDPTGHLEWWDNAVNTVSNGLTWVGNKIDQGVNWASNKVSQGIDWTEKKISQGINYLDTKSTKAINYVKRKVGRAVKLGRDALPAVEVVAKYIWNRSEAAIGLKKFDEAFAAFKEYDQYVDIAANMTNTYIFNGQFTNASGLFNDDVAAYQTVADTAIGTLETLRHPIDTLSGLAKTIWTLHQPVYSPEQIEMSISIANKVSSAVNYYQGADELTQYRIGRRGLAELGLLIAPMPKLGQMKSLKYVEEANVATKTGLLTGDVLWDGYRLDEATALYGGINKPYVNGTNGAEVVGDARKLWTNATELDGVKVYQRNDIIDPNIIDARGRTNLQRMEKGLAPIGPDGNPVNLHHMTQTNDSAIAEVTQSFHQQNTKVIHINPNTIPSGIDRTQFNTWKGSYWKNRANDFK